MGKYRYIRFKGVPKNIEREYNKMRRKEQYLEEKDFSHGVIHLSDDSCLMNVPEPCKDDDNEQQLMWERRLKYMRGALSLLHENFPLEYDLINDYFLSDKTLSIAELSEKYKISAKKVEYRLNKAKEILKKYIIDCELN